MSIEAWIQDIAGRLPLEQFSLAGGFLEEIVAPIPSPLVMTTAGSAALKQGHGHLYVLWLGMLGSLGKTSASWILYALATKTEDAILHKYGRFFGADPKQIAALSARLDRGWKDEIALTVLRAIPFAPSALLSIACGLVKIRPRTFLVTALIGNTLRSWFYLYLGFGGLAAYDSIARLDSAETVFKIIFGIALLALVVWLWRRRK